MTRYKIYSWRGDLEPWEEVGECVLQGVNHSDWTQVDLDAQINMGTLDDEKPVYKPYPLILNKHYGQIHISSKEVAENLRKLPPEKRAVIIYKKGNRWTFLVPQASEEQKAEYEAERLESEVDWDKFDYEILKEGE